MHEGTDPDGEYFYTQIFRDGCFEIVKNVVHDSKPGKEPPGSSANGSASGYKTD